MVTRFVQAILIATLCSLAGQSVYAVDTCQAVFGASSSSLQQEIADLRTLLAVKESSLANLAKVSEANRKVLALAQEQLAAHGTRSQPTLIDGRLVLVIVPDDTSRSLGRIAASLKTRFGYRLIYDAVYLAEGTALGFANAETKTIGVSTASVETGAADSILIHEVRHVYLSHLDERSRRRNDGETLLAARIATTGEDEFEIAGYRTGFRFDELSAFLTNVTALSKSLRADGSVDDANEASLSRLPPLPFSIDSDKKTELAAQLKRMGAIADTIRAYTENTLSRGQLLSPISMNVLRNPSFAPGQQAKLVFNLGESKRIEVTSSRQGEAIFLSARIILEGAEITFHVYEARAVNAFLDEDFSLVLKQLEAVVGAHRELAIATKQETAAMNLALQLRDRRNYLHHLRALRLKLLGAYYPTQFDLTEVR